MSDSDSTSSVQDSSAQDSPVQDSPVHRPGSAFRDAILPPFAEAQLAAIFTKIDSTFSLFTTSMNSKFKALDDKIMDVDTKVGGIDKRLVALDAKFDHLDQRVGNLETRVETMAGDISDLKGTVSVINAKVSGLDFRVGRLEKQMEEVQTTVKRLDEGAITVSVREDESGTVIEHRTLPPNIDQMDAHGDAARDDSTINSDSVEFTDVPRDSLNLEPPSIVITPIELPESESSDKPEDPPASTTRSKGLRVGKLLKFVSLPNINNRARYVIFVDVYGLNSNRSGSRCSESAGQV